MRGNPVRKPALSATLTALEPDARPVCPLTGARMVPELTIPRGWRRPGDNRSWQIWHSTGLDFGQILPRPDPGDIGAFYDLADYYTHADRISFDPRDESRAVGWPGRQLASQAWRFERGCEPTAEWWAAIIPPGARDGLEIGCGDGDRMLTFGPLLGHVRGVEPDPRAIRVARGRGPDVHEGTAEVLPEAVRDRRYGLIVFAHVLEHTLDPVLPLRNAGALLDDGGILSVEVPNNACEGRWRMGEYWRWTDAPRHLNFCTPESLVACAEAAGLTVQAVLYCGHVRQFLPDWILDEARIRARLEDRDVTPADVVRQVWHSAALLMATALAEPSRKYDSVRLLCSN